MAGAELPSQDGTEATRALVSVAHGEMTELTTPETTHLQPAAGWVLWAAERVPAVLPGCLISFLKLFMGPLIHASRCPLHLVTSPSAGSPFSSCRSMLTPLGRALWTGGLCWNPLVT